MAAVTYLLKPLPLWITCIVLGSTACAASGIKEGSLTFEILKENSAGLTSLTTGRFLSVSDSLLRSNPDSAFDFTLSYLLAAKSDRSGIREAYSRYQLGKCYFSAGFYELAGDSFREAVEVFQLYGDNNGLALTERSLGYLLFNSGRRLAGLERYLRALELKDYLENWKELSELYNRLGVTYASLDSADKSKDYFNKALVLGEYENDTLEIARTLNNMGYAMNMTGRPNEALNYLQESLFLKNKSRQGEATLCPTLNNMARAFLTIDQFDSAVAYSRESLSIARRLHLLQRQKEAHQLLKDVFERQANFRLAFDHLKQFHEINDSILNRNGARLAKSLIAQHNQNLDQTAAFAAEELPGDGEIYLLVGMLAIAVAALLVVGRLGGSDDLFDFAYLMSLVLLIQGGAALCSRLLTAWGLPAAGSALGSLLVVAAVVIALQKRLRSYFRHS